MKNEMKHEKGEGKQKREMERKMNYKGASKPMKPCKYKTKGKK
jgi:hypothetical protein